MPNLSRMLRQAHSALEEGDSGKARRLCSGILKYSPDSFDALHLLGQVTFQHGEMVEALRYFSAAARIAPGSAEAMSNLGQVFHATGRYEDAIASHRRALQIAPGHPDIIFNLGNSLRELGRHSDALAQFERVSGHEPKHIGAHVNRGNSLVSLSRPQDAIVSYGAALALMPGHPQILTNRGHALRRLDCPAEALADFQAALAAAPEFAEAHFEAAMAHLALGDFDQGWKEYEWRWRTASFARNRRTFAAPLWLGEGAIAGKTILLHAEQGFGDTIQFIRYAPLLAARDAKVICEVQPELLSLLSQLDGSTVIARGEMLPAFDLHCPLLSLPLAFGTQPETIPDFMPCLSASAERVASWQDRLPPGRPRAGFVWSGTSSHKNDGNRSIALSRLAPLFEHPAMQCFGLQSELRDADAETLRDLPDLINLGGDFRDFADTAAVISLLDVVISVDTAVAHLAGALGKPVILLLPHAADFRWMRGGDDTPWYPTAKLFRQPAFGDWDSVIARVGDALRQWPQDASPGSQQGSR